MTEIDVAIDMKNKHRSLFNVERLALIFTSNIFDIIEDFWKIILIDEICFQIKDFACFTSRIIDFSNSAFMITLNANIWKKTIERNINIDFIIYSQFDEQAKIKHDYLKRVFDYQLYQKQNTRKTCEKIEISWKSEKTIYKIPDMILRIQLKYWQFTNVKFLRNIRHSKLVKNCILTNYMKLDKTWTLLTFLLTVSHFFNSSLPVYERLSYSMRWKTFLPYAKKGFLVILQSRRKAFTVCSN